jgi:hypothetical protein
MIRQATRILGALAIAAALVSHAEAQTPPASAPPLDVNAVASLAWLDGCWNGNVNQREFREQWSPLRGGMLLGMSSTVYQGKTSSFEFLRIESRPDGVFYVALPSGQNETPFKLVSAVIDEKDKDAIFTFSNPEHDFPQRIIYRRGTEGWLYATIEGKYEGEDRQVIYPMRRIDCATGEMIRTR